jgi:peptidoglycan-associated lipoprotein
VTPQRFKIAFPLAVLATLLSTGCAKKTAKAQPPATPPPPSPTATLAANPKVIQQGQQTTLTWETNNATDVTIDGVGTVPASGSRTMAPGQSTTYNLIAKGPGGSSDASARVTVNMPIVENKTSPTDEDLFARDVKDVYFDYDKYDIRPSEEKTTEGDIAFFQEHSNVKFLIEGHCDDRGSEEYNIALGTNRAQAVKQSMVQHGVSADRIQTISYGKERPFCTQDNESCWQKNRVGHIVYQR